ncbi:hypothetical protein BDZ91DRAFT_710777 [Kalaharituber pfeilii]|nr:hypothetical protein BDZ91DRAFT_710777 [Kalaharituber pfeilii]
MPIPLLSEIFYNGLSSVPHVTTVASYAPYVLALYALKRYFRGASNTHERILHSKVIILTGGTSGIGHVVAHALASKGAQLVLLVPHTSDPYIVDFINDLRESTGNPLIYAEQCDLSSLHSIRLFATKWLDNAPPRRLDMILLLHGLLPPPSPPSVWAINYLSTYHLLTLFAPAIRAQPPDRDYLLRGYPSSSPWRAQAAAKLCLMSFLVEFQRRLDSYQRLDKASINARTYFVDPGFARTPGMRRFLSCGSVWGLIVYLLTWPLWWLVLKSAQEAAETVLMGAMCKECGEGKGGKFLKECSFVVPRRKEIGSVDDKEPEEEAGAKKEDKGKEREGEGEKSFAKRLWEVSEKMVEEFERRAAIERKRKQMREEGMKKSQKDKEAETEEGQKSGRIEEVVEKVEDKGTASGNASASASTSGVEAGKKAARTRKA